MKTALVTGASGGIGQALCTYLEDAGFNVLAHARNEEKAKSLVDAQNWQPIWGDVTRAAEIAAIAKQVKQHGKLDLLVNNAGILTKDTSLGENGMGPHAEVNVVAPAKIAHALIPVMQGTEDPTVLMVSSGMANFARDTDYCKLENPDGSALFGQYANSKAAVNTLTMELAKAYPHIRFLSIEPGFVKTKMTDGNPSMPASMRLMAKVVGASPEKAAHTCFDHVLGKDLPSGTITQSGKSIDSSGKKWASDLAKSTLEKLLAKADAALLPKSG